MIYDAFVTWLSIGTICLILGLLIRFRLGRFLLFALIVLLAITGHGASSFDATSPENPSQISNYIIMTAAGCFMVAGMFFTTDFFK